MFRNRWRIDAVLTTSSSFHLGDGGTTSREKLTIDRGPRKGQKVEIASVAVDHAGRASIPGRSIKGALRSWLDAHKGDETGIEDLFGTRRVTEDEPGAGGIAEFWDALLDEGLDADPHAKTGPHTVPYWCAKRHTGVVANVAIDRQRRTAVDRKLFHREFVPPGVSFRITVVAQDLDVETIALLLSGLRAFGRDLDPLSLGADTRDGWGRFAWTQESVHLLQPPGLDDWLKNGGHAYEKLPKAPKAVMEGIETKIADLGLGERDDLRIDLEIDFESPYLINDPSRAKAAGEDHASGKPDHAPLLDTAGEAQLSSSSLRGALRSQAERILRTIDPSAACTSTDPAAACAPIHDAAEAGTLCMACRVFGAPGWASTVSLTDFELTNKPVIKRQHFVGIDRFTAGVSAGWKGAAGGAKFESETALSPRYSGQVVLDRERAPKWAAGLLALTLRDLSEGDITLGFGAAKGFGRCHSTIHAQELAGSLESIREALGLAVPGEPRSGAFVQPGATDEGAAAITADARDASTREVAAGEAPVAGPAFLNPYHFIPVLPERRGDLATSDFRERRCGHVTHDRYVPDTYSGRMICRLETAPGIPLFVGAERGQIRDESAIVNRFEVNGKPAVPATSLRGMISSIAEAASNSALRVLEDRELSWSDLGTRRFCGKISQYVDREWQQFHSGRKTISVAEQLFGFVEQDVAVATQPDQSALALAGRVRFSAAAVESWAEYGEFRTRVLDSPKPPCPAFYFRPRHGIGHIAKAALSPDEHTIQGRKVYLHHTGLEAAPWASRWNDANKQKAWVKPVIDARFHFCVDFDNLSEDELALLCYSIRPSEGFHHKLGMGKAIGLGSVRIIPLGLFLVDRKARYAKDALDASRYHRIWLGAKPDEYPKQYAREAGAARAMAAQADPALFESLRARVAVGDEIRRALELLGDPANVRLPVHTPQITGSPLEPESFRWFVKNEQQPGPNRQYLVPLDAAASRLPGLRGTFGVPFTTGPRRVQVEQLAPGAMPAAEEEALDGAAITINQGALHTSVTVAHASLTHPIRLTLTPNLASVKTALQVEAALAAGRVVIRRTATPTIVRFELD
jgi:CRISPR/Cas system CSM-associated protein Csm3 (group 7 of RAMP superfamily)